MTNNIRIRPADGTWVVRSDDAVLGETTAALELSEGDYPSVIYFPRDDLAMALLEPSQHVTHCPHKGDAVHFSIVGPDQTMQDAAWSYQSPLSDLSDIRNFVAFYQRDDLKVEQL
jgi:uncharacterized protein (DUF427 family)